ncbi:dynamin family protein [Aeromicrobium terrae]|nr:dynamin family protein [Aeromicrobium terrae]
MNDIRESAAMTTARDLLDLAIRAYRREPEILETLQAHRVRLDEPLRVALVGSVKAGKSTLLNALLGEHLAPTDARECTRVVTWYRHGSTPQVVAKPVNGSPENLPVHRQHGRLELDLGDATADSLERIDVTWPADPLAELILVDTPGTVSISESISSRTQKFLAPPDGVSEADAVIYMLRSLHLSDVEFLHDVKNHHGRADGSAPRSIAVLSRADELGGGRLDAMVSVNAAAAKLRTDPALDGVCEALVPVAGLLALASTTLRQSEFSAFVALEKLPRDEREALLASVDRFITAEDENLPSPRVRASLVERFGVYGIRLAIAVLRTGIKDAPTLSAELVRRSGLDELRRVIDVHFQQRHAELKAHSAISAVYRVLQDNPREHTQELLEDAEEFLANAHAFREMRLISHVRSVKLALAPEELEELIRLTGGNGTSPKQRLGLDEDVDDLTAHRAAYDALWAWTERAEHPLIDRDTAAACRVVRRSCEGILDELSQAHFATV